MATFIAGWNMPGYLPEMEPAVFDSFEAAKNFILSELREQSEWGDDEELAEEFCHLAEDVNLESRPFSTPEIDHYVYWVMEENK